jgi:hypothetical protein
MRSVINVAHEPGRIFVVDGRSDAASERPEQIQ